MYIILNQYNMYIMFIPYFQFGALAIPYIQFCNPLHSVWGFQQSPTFSFVIPNIQFGIFNIAIAVINNLAQLRCISLCTLF